MIPCNPDEPIDPRIHVKENIYEIVHAYAQSMLEDGMEFRFYKERLRYLVFTFTKKFAKGQKPTVRSEVRTEEEEVVADSYYNTFEKIKRFCRSHLHATAPFFDPNPIFFIKHVTVNKYINQEIWHVIPEQPDLPLSALRYDRLRLLEYPGWLNCSDDDERIQMLVEIKRLQSQLSWMQRRDCTL